MLTIGIDSGTQSTKTLVLDTESGEILATAQFGYELVPDLPPGHLEQNPADWIEAARLGVAKCLEAVGPDRRGEIRAIGVSGQQHGLVPLDENDHPVRAAKLWCDTSTAAQCAQFSSHFGGESGLIELAGNPVLPGYTAPKILWLKQNEPENFQHTRSVLLPHDYLNFWLTGSKTMEYGDASGTALMNVRTREWCGPLIDFIDPRVHEMLPALQSSRQAAGTLRHDLAEELGLSAEIIVSAGGGDNMMGAIGTGNIVPGRVTASLGTSGTLYAYSEGPAIDEKMGEAAAFCDSTDAWLPLVCTMNVTVATEQVRALFGWDISQLEAAVRDVEAGARGLLFLPYLNGERTPNLPAGSGVFHGLTTKTMVPAVMARAVTEGVTLGLAYGMQRFAEMNIRPTEIRLTGGGSASPVWRQIVADVFGVPVVCLRTGEGAALGAAIQAALTVDGWDQLERMTSRLVQPDERTRSQPNPGAHELYKEISEKHISLTKVLHDGGKL